MLRGRRSKVEETITQQIRMVSEVIYLVRTRRMVKWRKATVRKCERKNPRITATECFGPPFLAVSNQNIERYWPLGVDEHRANLCSRNAQRGNTSERKVTSAVGTSIKWMMLQIRRTSEKLSWSYVQLSEGDDSSYKQGQTEQLRFVLNDL